MATVKNGKPVVKEQVRRFERPTYDVIGLTPGEWQTIRNALFVFSGSQETSVSANHPIDDSDETQGMAASRLMAEVFEYKGGSNEPAKEVDGGV